MRVTFLLSGILLSVWPDALTFVRAAPEAE